jgi:hypothetical protein
MIAKSASSKCCERAEGRERVPPILDAVRACRPVLLPRAQAAVEGILAAGEDLGLKSPSAGRHLSVKSSGCGGKAPVRFPLIPVFFNKLLVIKCQFLTFKQGPTADKSFANRSVTATAGNTSYFCNDVMKGQIDYGDCKKRTARRTRGRNC